MQGTVLSFHPETNKGMISGNDGKRYNFTRMNWTSTDIEPKENVTVDFDTDEKQALDIIVIKTKKAKGKKSKTTAIVWALLAGGIGAHKFYLGQTGIGLFYLLFCWTAIPFVIALVEIIYLVLLNEEEFDRRYNE